MAQGLLDGMTPAAFLRSHWQKKSLLVRGAMPDCAKLLVPAQLFSLATRDDVESRLVMRSNNKWTLHHGPFTRTELRRLPARNWTLLVQGIDQVLPQAASMLQQFSFIPHARLDDLMASYAPPGGGVGPHFDSYDVFLIQGMGERRWRTSAQKKLTLVKNVPLRILDNFKVQQQCEVKTGDLLYLPPRYAHDGVALTPCITYSVGFRAPTAQELGSRFLEHVQDNLRLEGIYQDADLSLQSHPAEISAAMLKKIAAMLKQVKWNDADVARFAGCYLSEPKSHVIFLRPRRPLPLATFIKRAAANGIRLALPSRMLFIGSKIYLNGEEYTMPVAGRRHLIALADRRSLDALTPDAVTASLLHDWYRAGYILV